MNIVTGNLITLLSGAAALFITTATLAQTACDASQTRAVEVEVAGILQDVTLNHMVLINATKKQQIESYFVRLRAHLQYLAGLPAVNRLINLRSKAGYIDAYRQHHVDLETFMQEFGLEDIILADLAGGVAYSATNQFAGQAALIDAPFRETSLGRVFEEALNAAPGHIALADISILPTRERLAAFAAAPVFSGPVKIGVAIIQWPISAINHLVSRQQLTLQTADDYGKTVESYLVADDLTLRSDPDKLVKNLEETLSKIGAVGAVTETTLQRLQQQKSGVGFLEMDTPMARTALSGTTSYDLQTNYRGETVFITGTPINVPGLNWAILTEMEEEVAMAGLSRVREQLKVLCQ